MFSLFLYLYYARVLLSTPKDQGSELSNIPARSIADDIKTSPPTPTPLREAHLKTLNLHPIPPIPISQEPQLDPPTSTPAKSTRSAVKRKTKAKANAAEVVPGEVATTDEVDVLPSAKKQKSASKGV